MILAIENILAPAEVEALRETAGGLRFGDGRVTAGRFARDVKANDQAVDSAERDRLLELVLGKIVG
ncbi:MAG: hypothetical protein V2I25_13920, partial [Woeseiaceae bacterium]|nr:hypothetical protein [Woeseiaceae bacterium]